ncbi:hypothetical protein [Roseateles sp.]|uniref:hypothetical protein n=1 Tax=Roseateles sp. TaxID=1971397 RepID=UPI0031DF1B13
MRDSTKGHTLRGIVAGLGLAGCAALGALAQGNTAPPGKSHDGDRVVLGDDNTYFHTHSRVRIPRGRIPPQGQCGLWYPDKKSDEQPPAFNCSPPTAVEPGGFLITPGQDPNSVEVAVYDKKRPGVVIARGMFDARTGGILRALDPKKASDAVVGGERGTRN